MHTSASVNTHEGADRVSGRVFHFWVWCFQFFLLIGVSCPATWLLVTAYYDSVFRRSAVCWCVLVVYHLQFALLFLSMLFFEPVVGHLPFVLFRPLSPNVLYVDVVSSPIHVFALHTTPISMAAGNFPFA